MLCIVNWFFKTWINTLCAAGSVTVLTRITHRDPVHRRIIRTMSSSVCCVFDWCFSPCPCRLSQRAGKGEEYRGSRHAGLDSVWKPGTQLAAGQRYHQSPGALPGIDWIFVHTHATLWSLSRSQSGCKWGIYQSALYLDDVIVYSKVLRTVMHAIPYIFW